MITGRHALTYKGGKGENIAVRLLVGKGYAILAENYRTRRGEIDIIAKDGCCTVFVEVKYRRHLGFGLPREAVTARKQRFIRQAALCYAAANGAADTDMRFDVIEIYGNDSMRVEHIENAF